MFLHGLDFDHAGVNFQDVAQSGHPPQQTVPAYPGPIHARIFLSNLCASHARPTSCDRPVLARLLTSNHAFNHETPWATRTLFGGSGRFPSSLCIPTYSHLSQ